MKIAAQNVSWVKVIVAAAVALIAAGATAALYTDQFATGNEVVSAVKAHSEGDGHPALRKDLRDVQDRLIRIEMQQDAMSRVQGAMDDKLDRLIDRASVPAWLVPPTRPAAIP